MIYPPARAMTWSRRRFIRTAATRILAAPALLLAHHAVLAEEQTPLRSVYCPELNDCGYRYDPSVGDPDGGVPPGVAFEDLPEDWECPECGTPKHLW